MCWMCIWGRRTREKRGVSGVRSLPWASMSRCVGWQACYHDVLLALPKEVMPNLVSPLMLSDFLTDSFKIGMSVCVCVSEGGCSRTES